MDGCGKGAMTSATFAGPRRCLRPAVAHLATAPPAAAAGASASIATYLSEQKPAATAPAESEKSEKSKLGSRG